MPLKHSKSKKAFEHNIKAEMDAGKPQPQALAIAYSVKRKAPKKMAEGGKVNESAKTEHRPMPEEMDHDKHEMHAPEAHMAKPRPKMVPLEQPSLRGSDVFKVRYSSGLEPAPAKRDEEMAEHEEHMDQEQMMAEGGKIKLSKHHDENAHLYESDKGSSNQGAKVRSANRSKSWAKDDRSSSPSIERSMAKDRMGEARSEAAARLEKTKALNPNIKGLAEGGMIDEDLDHEIEDERHSSLAAAIMAKRRELAELESGAHDEDKAAMMAEGGEVDLEENAEEMPNAYYGKDEAILKEHYGEDLEHMDQPEESNEHGDDIESDRHDMINQIRRKMKHKMVR